MALNSQWHRQVERCFLEIIAFTALSFLFIFLLGVDKSTNLTPRSCSVIPVSISDASEQWTPARAHTHTHTHTHTLSAGGAYYEVLASISGRHHHSGSTSTWSRVAVEHNVRQHNGAEQDTMFPRAEPKQLIWRRRQMAVSKQVIDWTRLAIRSLVLFSCGQKISGVSGL